MTIIFLFLAVRLSALICAYLRFRPQCLNDSTIGTRRSALDYSTSLFRLPQVTVAFHDHGRSPSVAFHSLPQPNPVPSPTVTYGRLPTATEAKIAFFQKLRFRSPEQNGPKRTKTELIVPGHFAFYTLHSALNDPCPPVRFAPSSPASTSIDKHLQAWFFSGGVISPTINTTYRGAIVFGLRSLRRPEPAERSEVPIHFIGSIRDLSGSMGT